eukprot:gene7279-11224_t
MLAFEPTSYDVEAGNRAKRDPAESWKNDNDGSTNPYYNPEQSANWAKAADNAGGKPAVVVGDGVTEEQKQVIEKHTPVVVFHPLERYFPSSVDGYLAGGAVRDTETRNLLHKDVGPATNLSAYGSNTNLYPADIDSVKFGDQPTAEYGVSPPMYVRVKRLDDGYINVEYHLFFPFSGEQLMRRSDGVVFSMQDIGAHDGDWENFTVRFQPDFKTPHAYAFSYHGTAIWVKPDNPNLQRNAHGRVMAWSACYSHGMHMSPHDYDLETIPLGFCFKLYASDLCSPRDIKTGIHWFPKQCVVIQPETNSPLWCGFKGRWGARRQNRLRKFTRLLPEGSSDNCLLRGMYGFVSMLKIGTDEGNGPHTPWFAGTQKEFNVLTKDLCLTVSHYTTGIYGTKKVDGKKVTDRSTGETIGLTETQRIVCRAGKYQTYKEGVVDGKTCLILSAGQRVVSRDGGYTSYVSGVVDGKNVVVLEENQIVASKSTNYKSYDGKGRVGSRHGVKIVAKPA